MEEHERPELAEELARAIYRLTDALSPEEPLRRKLREAALDVAILLRQPGEPAQAALGGKIDELLLLLAVGRHQGFANEGNFIALAQFYQDFCGRNPELHRPPEKTLAATPTEPQAVRPGSPQAVPAVEGLNQRQKKIVQHFRYQQSFQLREVRVLFEGYSQKTLRNDLKELCRKGMLEREGVGTVSRYRVANAPV